MTNPLRMLVTVKVTVAFEINNVRAYFIIVNHGHLMHA